MKKQIFLFLIALFLFQACGKKVITRKYYVLEFPPKADSTEVVTPLTKDVCEILPMRMSPAYAQRRIAIRKQSHQINYFNYHQWAENPNEVVMNLIEKELQKSHIFGQISSTIWNVVPQYQLSVQVFQIEAVEIEEGEILNAHFHGRFDLYDRANNRIAVVHNFNKYRFLEVRDINLLAKELSNILYDETHNFIERSSRYIIEQNRSRINDAVQN